MQATLDARALKPFTRALTCISKYGDEMIIHAEPDSLVLTSMNQPKTAFCSFTYGRAFFQRYTLAHSYSGTNIAGPSRSNRHETQEERVPSLKCQLQTKSLLSILKHRNTDKSTEKCELTVIDGVETAEEEIRDDEDTLESRLIVRLHCKHGVIKTHRLLLNNPTNDGAPIIQSGDNESRIVVQARAVKEIIEHFPNSKGPKSDPELIWRFDEDEVRVKSMEKGIDAKGKSQLATELTLGANEFDVYDVILSPLTIGFFLREFNATITLADALLVPIDMRFTRPAEPVYISVDADECTMLFVIATNQVRGEENDPQPQARANSNQNQNQESHRSVSGVSVALKRAFEDDANAPASTRVATPDMRRPRVVQQNGNSSLRPQSQPNTSAPPRSFNSGVNAGFQGGGGAGQNSMYIPPEREPECAPTQSQPLFLASQLSTADMDAIRASGLGIEDMDAEEFAAMLDGDGEEVNFGAPPPATSSGESNSRPTRDDELEYDELDDDMEMGPTQEGGLGSTSEKAFQPLFED